MATLIFDIETVGEDWDEFGEVTRQTLTRWIDRTARSEEERQAQLEDLKDGLGFSPLTGSIVALGLYDLERHQGAVYYVGPQQKKDEFEKDYVLRACSEAELLHDFWEGAHSYDTFVTFNGRCFDVPFILNRSLVHDVKPTKDLMNHRYLSMQKETRHVDLLDQLTFYGAMYRKPSLHLFCRAFGIESPKVGGVAGDDVAELFRGGKFRDIARYNIRDVVATTELYQKWYRLLAPEYFKVID